MYFSNTIVVGVSSDVIVSYSVLLPNDLPICNHMSFLITITFRPLITLLLVSPPFLSHMSSARNPHRSAYCQNCTNLPRQTRVK